MKRTTGFAFLLLLCAATTAHAAGPDWGKVIKEKAPDKRFYLLIEAPYLDVFRVYAKRNEQERYLDFVLGVKANADKKTLFNRFVKDGAERFIKFSDKVRKDLLAVGKKATTLVKGKLPAGVWDKLDFTQAEIAARASFRADSLNEFISATFLKTKILKLHFQIDGYFVHQFLFK